MSKLIPIIVLDDGETYSGVDGASICLISDQDMEKIWEGYSLKDIDPVFEFGLQDWTAPPQTTATGQRLGAVPESKADGIDWEARCREIAAGIANGEEWAVEACDRIHAEAE